MRKKAGGVCETQFNLILDGPNHRLNELVPRSSFLLNYNLRKKKTFNLFIYHL